MFLKHKILTLFGIALFPVALSASDDADNNRQRQYKDILYLENIFPSQPYRRHQNRL